LRNIVLILTLRHSWVPLDDFWFIVWISDLSLLLLTTWVVWSVLLVLLVEYLSDICTWLVVTETRLALILTLSNSFFTVVFFGRCLFIVLLTSALLKCLVMCLALVMTVSNYWLL